mgnify:CR=1 FL=1
MSADASPSKRPTGVLVGLAALAVCAAVIFLIRRGSEGVDPEDLEGLTTREVSVVPGTETATPRDAADKDGGTGGVVADVAPAKREEIVPPRGLDAEAIERVQALAITCHEALQCDGLSRTDMIVTNDGPVVLEGNTMPGFTAASLYPKSAAAQGISDPELLDRLIDRSLKLPTRKEILSGRFAFTSTVPSGEWAVRVSTP